MRTRTRTRRTTVDDTCIRRRHVACQALMCVPTPLQVILTDKATRTESSRNDNGRWKKATCLAAGVAAGELLSRAMALGSSAKRSLVECVACHHCHCYRYHDGTRPGRSASPLSSSRVAARRAPWLENAQPPCRYVGSGRGLSSHRIQLHGAVHAGVRVCVSRRMRAVGGLLWTD